MSTATASPIRATRAPKSPAAPTGSDRGAGHLSGARQEASGAAAAPAGAQLILRMELPVAIEAALLAAHAQGKGTTNYQGMRAAAMRVYGIG